VIVKPKYPRLVAPPRKKIQVIKMGTPGRMWGWKLDTTNKVETSAEDCKSYANSIRASAPTRAAIWDWYASFPAPLVLATDYGSAHGASGVTAHVTSCVAAGTVFFAWLYSIPNRNQSGGGASSEAAYKTFVDGICAALAAFGPNVRALFEIEPDALPKCYALSGGLSGAESLMRQRCVRYACEKLRAVGPGVRVYINAGNSNFRSASEIAGLLSNSGIEFADGIALNTAQSYTIAANYAYFLSVKAINAAVLGCTISTTKIGPVVEQAGWRSNVEYYNEPPLGFLAGQVGTGGTRPNLPNVGITLGPVPTTDMDTTDFPGLDALLWSKFAGTSDDVHPGVGESPEYLATAAPGPGQFYPSYWELVYNASVGKDWSQFAPMVPRVANKLVSQQRR
jgi:hypothetical protein